MTLYRRNARISMGCAAVFAGAALCLANSPYWPGTLLNSYLAFGAVWYGQDQRRRHHRRMLEEEWWRRTRLGVRQPPLDPCCMPFDETSLHHDEGRCTRDRIPGLWIEQALVEDLWNQLIADLADLNQEEEA